MCSDIDTREKRKDDEREEKYYSHHPSPQMPLAMRLAFPLLKLIFGVKDKPNGK
jgi:hypothetical protein